LFSFGLEYLHHRSEKFSRNGTLHAPFLLNSLFSDRPFTGLKPGVTLYVGATPLNCAYRYLLTVIPTTISNILSTAIPIFAPMKFLCHLFVLLVLLLTTKPCCADTDCGNKILSVKNISAQSSPKEKDCQGCSPFFACGSCSGFTITKPHVHTLAAISIIIAKPATVYNQPYTEDVTLSIWQPPQLG
jgi:hypothetical protein